MSKAWMWGLGVLGVGGVALASLKLAAPHQVLAKVGLGVRGVKTGRVLIVWPYVQRYTRVNMTAGQIVGQTEDVFTSETHNIRMWWVANFQPESSDAHIERYINRLSELDTQGGVEPMLTQMITSMLRGMAARTPLNDINRERSPFAKSVESPIQELMLNQYGLGVQFNITKLESVVLPTLNRRLEAEAKSSTDVETGLAQQTAEQRTTEQRRQTAVVVAEQDQLKAKANADLKLLEANIKQSIGTRNAEAVAGIMMREQELRRQVEEAKQAAETAAIRATTLATAQVEAEAVRVKSDAELYRRQQEAKGVQALGEAEAAAINAKGVADASAAQLMVEALGGSAAYIGANLVRSGQLPEIAKGQAEALSRATIFAAPDRVGSVARDLIPFAKMLEGVGYQLPDWLLKHERPVA